MSRFIYFNGLTVDDSERSQDIITDLLNTHPVLQDAIDEDGSGLGEDINWEQQDDDMKEFSLRYPGVLFCFECENSNGGFWKDYYKDGKYQNCDGYIVYPPFDETKLI